MQIDAVRLGRDCWNCGRCWEDTKECKKCKISKIFLYDNKQQVRVELSLKDLKRVNFLWLLSKLIGGQNDTRF